MAEYLIGFAEVDVTPPIGVQMAGYYRKSPAEGIHDRLKAIAVVFDDRGGEKSAICVADVCGMDATLVASVRRRVGGAMKPERIMIAATHTHSGPSLVSDNLLNQRWRCELEDRLVDVIREADISRRPARIGVGAGEVAGVGGNRRDPVGGIVDRTVTVMRVDDVRAGGALMGVIVNHACHATTLGIDNLLISADYPGEVRTYVQSALEGKPVVLFLNGACGDINPGGYSAEDSALGKSIPNRTFERAHEIGRIIGSEAVALTRSLPPRAEFLVRGGHLPVRLPMRRTLLPAEAEAALRAAKARTEAARQTEVSGQEMDRLNLEQVYAEIELGGARKRFGLPNGEWTSEIQALGVGDAVFLGMPGEVFNEIGIALRKASPFKQTFLVGYANDGAGYFPTVQALRQGGYEVKTSMFGDVAVARMEGWARLLLGGVFLTMEHARQVTPQAAPPSPYREPILLNPRHVIRRAKFPAIDFHLHCVGSRREAKEKVEQLDLANVRCAVNLIGDMFSHADMEPALRFAEGEQGRLLYFFGYDFERLDDPDWPDYVGEKTERELKAGCRGIKIYKELGLVYRDSRGNLVLPDDDRLDPIWDAAARRGIPVVYHVADPLRNFAPLSGTRGELQAMDEGSLFWKFGAPGYPTHEQLLQCEERLAAKHPRTTFVFPHLASMDSDLQRCGALLAKNPNVYVDTAARLLEMGYQPHTSREFCLAFADRVLWGTDFSWPNESDGYCRWFQFLETWDEAFSPGPSAAAMPRVYGLGLPDEVLKKVYGENAARLLGVRL